MRILSIRLKNINSLRGEHRIDLDRTPFREAGLFAIVGATGSGKSTLLDCITLALYGQVPRIGAVGKGALEKGGVVLTKHERECYAEVRYACDKGIFESRWSIGKTRNNTFRSAEMKLINEAGEMVAGSVSEVPARNVVNIGLDYDQFLKSILLCQGDFAKFLQSDKNKRAELLEKITGTHEFRKLGSRAYREYGRRKKELDVLEASVGMAREGLLSEEDRAQLEAELNQIDVELKAKGRELDLARQVLDKKTRLADLRAALENKRGQLQTAEENVKAFQAEYGETIRHYDALKGFRGDLDEHRRRKVRMDELEGILKATEGSISKAEAEAAMLVDRLKAVVREEVSADDFMQHLNALKEKVREIASRRKELQDRGKISADRIRELLKQKRFRETGTMFRKEGDNDALLMRLRKLSAEGEDNFRKAMAELKIADADLQTHKEELQQRNNSLHQLLSEVRSYKSAQQRLSQAEKALVAGEGEIGILADAESSASSELTQLERAVVAAEKEREELLRASSMDELRKELVDGEPCPLCGSLHHPYLHEFAKKLIDRVDELDALKNIRKSKQDELERVRLNLHTARARAEMEKQNRELANEELSQHQERIAELKMEAAVTEVKKEDSVKELLALNSERLGKAEQCILFKLEHPALQMLISDVLAFDETCSAFAIAGHELDKLYAGTDFDGFYLEMSAGMEGSRAALAALRQQWKSGSEEYQKESRQFGELDGKLLPLLVQKGYSGAEEARACLVSEEEYSGIQQRGAAVSLAATGARVALEEVDKLLKKESEGDDPLLSLEGQQARVTEVENRMEQLTQQRDERKGKLAGDDSKIASIKESEEKRQQMIREIRPWTMLNELIGSATGDKFNRFAQELTLDKLLILANRRLEKLHSRYSLKLPEGDDDLRVADGYMGGEVRTVRSVSGGETFMLSLALALGLSDLASRDIRIDSLFIDEGFGSLDPETLEEAMTTLEQLQAEQNKMVGIISHVESLKERIYTQIRLEKGNSGFSTMSIFPAPETDEPKG